MIWAFRYFWPIFKGRVASIWRADAAGQYLPSDVLPAFDAADPHQALGHYAVQIQLDDQDQDKFAIGAHGVAAIYTGGGGFAAMRKIAIRAPFLAELALSAQPLMEGAGKWRTLQLMTGHARTGRERRWGCSPTPTPWRAAVDELEISGFDRAAVSVLATDEKIKERVGRLYRSATEAADAGQAPQAAFVSTDSRAEGEAAAIAVPFQIGGFAGAFAVVAAGGALATAIAATIGGGVVGAGPRRPPGARHGAPPRRSRRGAACAERPGVVGKHAGDAAEKRALAVLTKGGARSVHVHHVERQWRIKDTPLHDVQPDPLLERDL